MTMAGIVAFKTIAGILYSIYSLFAYLIDCCCPTDCCIGREPRSRQSFMRDEWNDKYENYLAFRDHFIAALEKGEFREKKKRERDLDTPFYRWN